MEEIKVSKLNKGEEFLQKIIDYTTLTVKWDEVWKIPEFEKLKTTEQTPIWHGEGVVANHLQRVVEEMYKLCPIEDGDVIQSTGEGSNRWRKRFYLVIAALFHDIGKGVTTKWNEKKMDWSSYGHDIEGEKITRKLLWDWDFNSRELVCSLVRNHMKPLYVLDKKDVKKEIITLANECNGLEYLITLKRADNGGSIMSKYDGWIETLNEVEKKAKEYNCYYHCYTFNNIPERHKFYFGNEYNYESTTVYIMMGLPGSGKSTYYDKFFKDDNNIKLLSRDIIRSEIGIKGDKPQGNQEEEEKVTRIFNERLIEYVKNKQEVVIDNTNLKRKYRDAIKNILKKYNTVYVYVYIEAPTYQDNLDRRKGQIPEHVIENMRNSFDFPHPCEYELMFIDKQKKK